MRRLTAVVTVAVFVLGFCGRVLAHCEIPCGIYGDDARFAAIAEDLETVKKSMMMIDELSVEPAKNMNQLVRWVNNKEQHADHIREIITQYFLTQRIKVPAEGDEAAYKAYTEKLAVLHQMMVAAMKCKQTTDQANVEMLHGLLHKFEGLYKAK